MIPFFAEASQVVLFLLGVFLIIVVLLQRGRGGGLAGAFGGMGGQSAFGTKAGDVFTRITIILAICWVVLAGGSGYLLRAAARGQAGEQFQGAGGAETAEDPGSEGALGGVGDTSSGGPGTEGMSSTPGTIPSTGGTPAGQDATPSGADAPGTAPAPENNALPAPSTTPEGGSSSSTPADNPDSASATPEQPAPAPQDK